MAESQHPLNQHNVNKLVNKRLGLALLLILPVVGLSSYFLQQHTLLENIQQIVIKRGNQFTLQLGNLLADPQAVDNGVLQLSFNAFAKPEIIYTEGFFVSAILADSRGKIAARFQRNNLHVPNSSNKILQQTIDRKDSLLSEMSIQRINFDNSLYFLLHFPIKTTQNKTIGQAALLFLPSEEHLHNIQNSIWETTLAASTIVLLTTFAIYPVIIRLTRQLSHLSFDLLHANIETVKALGNAIAKKDSDTDAHNYRVTIYSVRLAEAIGLEPAKIQGLIKGAFLHDIGKIGTPDHILLKPGKLTDNEFKEMKNHVSYGVEIIKNSRWLHDAEDVVLHHHEKYNGSGYTTNKDPTLAGKKIPIVARVFAIADVFDALSSRRPYKEPFDFDTTLAEMEKNVGTHFDPEIFVTFKTIARPLYDKLANREDELPKNLLKEIVQKYFLNDLEQLLSNHT